MRIGANNNMKDNDLFTRRDAEITLLNKGQHTMRYRLGDIWELNLLEIREAFDNFQPTIIHCKECKHFDKDFCKNREWETTPDWFCADGRRASNG